MLEITIFNSFSFFCALWPVKVCKFFTLLNICGSNPEWHLTSADSCTNIFQVFKMIHARLMATKILSQLCLTMWPGHCSMFMGPGFCFYAAVIIGPCSDSHPLTAALCSKAAFFALCDNTLTLIITAHFHPRYSEIENSFQPSGNIRGFRVSRILRSGIVTELWDAAGHWTFQMIRGFVPVHRGSKISSYFALTREVKYVSLSLFTYPPERVHRKYSSQERNLQNMTNWRHLLTLESDETRCLEPI